MSDFSIEYYLAFCRGFLNAVDVNIEGLNFEGSYCVLYQAPCRLVYGYCRKDIRDKGFKVNLHAPGCGRTTTHESPTGAFGIPEFMPPIRRRDFQSKRSWKDR